ncbi:MAG TPA: hypothetical protein ENJ01_12095 [Gammaproteobacteria bacterium]|nr:hypothetical protein [Gammaproteobacteria bacterium]
MGRRQASQSSRQRQALAQLAARILLEAGNRDYAAAKRKAAEKLGLGLRASLPANAEIEAALAEYQRLFHGDAQAQRLDQLRHEALQAMRLLEAFSPRLVGAVLRGTADANSPVHLHVFADHAETLLMFLMDQHIPCEQDQRQLRYGGGREVSVPVVRFHAGDVRIELTVLPFDGLREAPLSPVDGRPMARADSQAVQALIDSQVELPPVTGG